MVQYVNVLNFFIGIILHKQAHNFFRFNSNAYEDKYLYYKLFKQSKHRFFSMDDDDRKPPALPKKAIQAVMRIMKK